MVILRGPDPSLPSYNAGHVTDRNHLTRLRDDGVIAMVSIFLSHDSSLVLTYFYNPCTQGCRPADRESLLSVRPYLSSCLYSSRVAFTLPNLRSLNLSLPFPPSFPPTPLPSSPSPPSVLLPSLRLPSSPFPPPKPAPPCPTFPPPIPLPFSVLSFSRALPNSNHLFPFFCIRWNREGRGLPPCNLRDPTYSYIPGLQ